MTPPTRICVVSEIFHPEDRGGQGRQAYELASALQSCGGHSVCVLTRRHYRTSSKRERVGNLDVRRLPPLGLWKGQGWRALYPTFLFMMALTWALLRSVRRYDFVLVNGVKLTLVPPLLMQALFGKRVVVKIDATAEIEQAVTPESLARMHMRSDSLLVRKWTRFRRSLLLRADAIVAISGELREALLRAGVTPARVADIPNGIDLQRWQPVKPEEQQSLRKQLELPDGPVFVCVGRLSRAKGLPLLLDVWLSVCAQHPRAHLLIIGTGTGSHDDCERELHAACEKSPHREQVIFTGHVENVHEYLKASDLFIQCSEHEGFGLALVEAMVCGLPCVTTPVGAAIDVIEPRVNGVLVPIGDRDALAAALRDLLASPSQWRPMGRAAHQSAVARYDMEQVVHCYGELFARLCTPASAERSLSRVPQ